MQNTQTPYFNETGPIYQQEQVQANEFVHFVRAHVVAVANTGTEHVRFDWEAFRAAVASSQGPHLVAERDLDAVVSPSTATVRTVLDDLVARFATAFPNVVAAGSTDAPTVNGAEPYFFETLRRNVYHAFTALRDHERCLSFYTAAEGRSSWEYRLLFVRPAGAGAATGMGAVKGLVMTVTLEGDGAEEAWYGVSLDARGRYGGTLRATEVLVRQDFRCP